jgi:plastocyanin
MRSRIIIGAIAAAVVALPGVGRAAEPVLLAHVGPDDGFVISFTHTDGTPVTHLDPGTYRVDVQDDGGTHDFRLHGPGVDLGTTYSFLGRTSWTVTFTEGYYGFYCAPHQGQMQGTFTVGSPPTPTLRASTDGARVSLVSTAGEPVTHLDPGRYSIAVEDNSTTANVRLSGPGVVEATQVHAFASTVWTLTLADGAYTLFSESDPAALRTGFTVGTPTPPPTARTLTAITGRDFAMTLLAADGTPLTRLDPGDYEIRVRDTSDVHNFHLTGPGVDRATALPFVGDETWQVSLRAGRYTFVCDPHTLTMRGSFSVGAATQPPPPPPPVRRLRLAVSARGALSASPRHLSAGVTVVTVRDASSRANVHVSGPGLDRRTALRFRGTATWRVRLRAGTYRVRSDARPGRRLSLMVM